MISKSLSTSEKYCRLHDVAPALADFCHALYPLLVAHSDDFGRQPGDLFTVKHVVIPVSPHSLDDLASALGHLNDVGLIRWYESGGRKYIAIVDFEQHQSGLHKRTESKFPEPPELSGKVPGIPVQLNLTELKGTKEKSRVARATRHPPPDQQPEDNLAVITKVAHTVIDLIGLDADVGEMAEAVKGRCASLHIAYNSGVVAKAIESATWQRRHTH